MVDVINLQRKIKLDLDPIRAFVADAAANVSEADGKKFSVAFISDDRMRKLNHAFRGKDATTDVLSFPHEPDEYELIDQDPSHGAGFLGDIVISAEQARKQAAENDLSIEDEIKQLVLHGLLHLCGYDHESDSGEMNAREIELRGKLGI